MGAAIITVAAVYLLNILSVTVAILLWTMVIVFCLRGTVDKLEQQGMRRGLGTTLAYLIMFALMFLVGAILLSPTIGFSDQMHNLIASLPAYVNQITVWANEQYAQYADFLIMGVFLVFSSCLNSSPWLDPQIIFLYGLRGI